MHNRIKALRKQYGVTLQQVATVAKTDKSQILRLENGERRLTVEWMERISRAFPGCRPQDLMDVCGGADMSMPGMAIPVLGNVTGGVPAWRDELPAEETVFYGEERPGLFALRVDGNSMNRIAPDGYLVMVDSTQRDPQRLVDYPVIARIEDETTFKRLRAHPYRLEPDSTERYDTVFPGESWEIIGRVIGTIGYFE